jgi:hypothetical protein
MSDSDDLIEDEILSFKKSNITPVKKVKKVIPKRSLDISSDDEELIEDDTSEHIEEGNEVVNSKKRKNSMSPHRNNNVAAKPSRGRGGSRGGRIGRGGKMPSKLTPIDDDDDDNDSAPDFTVPVKTPASKASKVKSVPIAKPAPSTEPEEEIEDEIVAEFNHSNDIEEEDNNDTPKRKKAKVEKTETHMGADLLYSDMATKLDIKAKLIRILITGARARPKLVSNPLEAPYTIILTPNKCARSYSCSFGDMYIPNTGYYSSKYKTTDTSIVQISHNVHTYIPCANITPETTKKLVTLSCANFDNECINLHIADENTTKASMKSDTDTVLVDLDQRKAVCYPGNQRLTLINRHVDKKNETTLYLFEYRSGGRFVPAAAPAVPAINGTVR